MQKIIISFIFVLCFANLFSQDTCQIRTSPHYQNLKIINAEKVKCIAQNRPRPSLFFTFGIWCYPCRLHAKGAYDFAKEHNLNFYVVLIENDKEKNYRILKAIDFWENIDKNINILLVSNEYSSRPRAKNKKFLTEITPTEFENIDDMSKYILVNNSGKVEMVTSYKDFGEDDWRDDSGILARKILPLIK
ncbi:hypothetical protein D1Z98_09270 [Riemerella anatipestifer]|uniref:hypothetical protein n=1 Tax=Riemerella anatipestifer TaxID=34085 RepID=UPI00129D87AE|nr:hypothetical protein [Riemerella anatipestifer]MDR7795372.1 hypothetical protein [Riemerella anatipestifer]MRM95148.1 hypothetical protein [Riemerella anatipestifer]